MKQLVFIGIDVSKLSLDLCIVEEVKTLKKISNNVQEIKSTFKNLSNKYGADQLIVGVENTGMYNWDLNLILNELSIAYFLINPLNLKRSIGLTRGKNDVVDAERIAKFTEKNYQDLIPTQTPSKQVVKLKLLAANRKRLIKTKSGLTTAVNELNVLNDKSLYRVLLKINSKAIKEIQVAITKVEAQILELIKGTEQLNRSYQLIRSVPGVGPILACELLIKTNCFKSIKDPRKLACYAGVVPFEYQSGTSIYRKPRVSLFADRNLKKLLHMAALRVTQLDGELQVYYLRKVAEGKNKMTVINAIRNKIVHRVCAVIRNQKPYQNYLVLS